MSKVRKVVIEAFDHRGYGEYIQTCRLKKSIDFDEDEARKFAKEHRGRAVVVKAGNRAYLITRGFKGLEVPHD